MPALVGVGGFGNSFVEIGASAVVAPLWSVDDKIAHKVATEFYRAVVGSPTIPFAEILRRIRAMAILGMPMTPGPLIASTEIRPRVKRVLPHDGQRVTDSKGFRCTVNS